MSTRNLVDRALLSLEPLRSNPHNLKLTTFRQKLEIKRMFKVL